MSAKQILAGALINQRIGFADPKAMEGHADFILAIPPGAENDNAVRRCLDWLPIDHDASPENAPTPTAGAGAVMGADGTRPSGLVDALRKREAVASPICVADTKLCEYVAHDGHFAKASSVPSGVTKEPTRMGFQQTWHSGASVIVEPPG